MGTRLVYKTFQFCYNMMYFMDFSIRYLLSDQETCKRLLSEPQQENHQTVHQLEVVTTTVWLYHSRPHNQ